MEEIWINEFIYTKDIITECQKTWWKSRIKTLYAFIGIVALVLVAMEWGQNMLSLLLSEIVLLIAIIVAKGIGRNSVREECESFEMLYGSRAPQVRIEVRRYIYYKSGVKERQFSLSDIRKVLESKNLILICFRGNIILQLHKQGFIRGDEKTCIAYLKSEMKSR